MQWLRRELVRLFLINGKVSDLRPVAMSDQDLMTELDEMENLSRCDIHVSKLVFEGVEFV